MTARIPTLFLLTVWWILLGPQHARAQTLSQAARTALEQSMVMAILMTTGDNIQLGFMDFDPNELTGLDDDALGNDNSLTSRSELTMMSLPWHYTPMRYNQSLTLSGQIAFLNEYNEVYLTDTSGSSDIIDTTILDARLGASWRHRFDMAWSAIAGLNGHVLEYRNDTQFRSPDSRTVGSLTDGQLTNIRAHSWLLEPTLGMEYLSAWYGMQARFHSTWHYLDGGAIKPDNAALNVSPQAWYWSNGIRLLQPLFVGGGRRQNLMYSLSQINVGGQLEAPVGSNRYYEFGLGWFIDTSDLNKWVDNVGLSAVINYGSDLRGGTLVLLYNVR